MKKFGMMTMVAAALMLCAPAFAGIDLGRFDRAVLSGSDQGRLSFVLQDETGEPAAKKSKIDKEKLEGWGGFGGPLVQYIQLDTDPFAPMTKDRGLDDFDDQMLLIGGMGGFIYKDFRMGGYGMGNSQEVSDRILNQRMSAHLSLGGGGVFLEANHTFNPAFGLAAGAMLGGGGIKLEASGPDLGPDGHWEADTGFFMAYPYLGFWVAPVKYMWLQASAGYLYFDIDTTGDDFENDLDVNMVDGNIRGGFSAMVTLNFGYNPNQ